MAKKTKIPVHTCTFIHSSDFFKGFAKLKAAFLDSNAPFGWGDNNRSLVTVDDICSHLNNCAEPDCTVTVSFEKRCEAVGWQTFVDLEN